MLKMLHFTWTVEQLAICYHEKNSQALREIPKTSIKENICITQDGTTMTPLGKCTLKCAKGEMSRDTEFFIIDDDVRPLLGAETC